MSVEIPSDCSRTRQIRFKCRLKSLHCGDTGGMERRGRGRRDRARPSTRCDCRVSVGSARLIRSGLPGHPSVRPSVRSFPPYSLPRSFIRRLRSRRDSPRLSLSLSPWQTLAVLRRFKSDQILNAGLTSVAPISPAGISADDAPNFSLSLFSDLLAERVSNLAFYSDFSFQPRERHYTMDVHANSRFYEYTGGQRPVSPVKYCNEHRCLFFFRKNPLSCFNNKRGTATIVLLQMAEL